jgi:hypothetical protein
MCCDGVTEKARLAIEWWWWFKRVGSVLRKIREHIILRRDDEWLEGDAK